MVYAVDEGGSIKENIGRGGNLLVELIDEEDDADDADDDEAVTDMS